MFINKVQHIGSVGRFRRASAEGDVAFKKYTLVLGENGRGKTTLCAILRSLQTGNADIIIGRKTLADDKEPNVVVALSGATAIFRDGGWNRRERELRIFDTQYVADNVYLGDAIGASQRRNLCNLILGREGVSRVMEYNAIDADILGKNDQLREALAVLNSHVSPAQIAAFVALTPDSEIETKIAEKRAQVDALSEIDRLRSQPAFEKIEVPPLPSRLKELLGKNIEDVSRDAETAVRQHLKAHGMQDNEHWLSTGLMHAGDDCPWCGQSLESVTLIDAFRSYFSAAYITLRDELVQYQQLPGRVYSDDRIEILRSRIESNERITALWKRYISINAPRLTAEFNISEVITDLRTEMLTLIERKSAAPLDPVKIPDSYEQAYLAFANVCEALAAYNGAVDEANNRINEFKRSANVKQLKAVTEELTWLEVSKKRWQPAVIEACEQYQTLNAEKQALERKKVAARDRIDAYSVEVSKKYRTAVNRVLKLFNAGFTVDQMRVEYSGRMANSTFCVVINETPVEMGTRETPLNQPSFKNTLSAGDKSTLALAFFLAELEADPDKANCVVVFDDPFNSQDHFRRTCTATEIKRCGKAVSQVVVMSHDRSFLRDLWDLPLPNDNRKALRLIPVGHKDTLISEWAIETDTESDDDANRRVLLDYYHRSEGKPRDVIQKLRPVLETHMQRVAPQMLRGVKGLGNMLDKVKDANSPPILLDVYDDIDDINSYTRRYMHGEGRNPNAEPINDAELQGFVGKALEIAGAVIET